MLAALIVAVLAQAPPEPGLGLRWEAPPGCPTGEEVRARVARLVGEEAVLKTRLVARGVVRADAGAWALDLELAGETGGGRRALRSGRCEGLLGAAALVIAIAVDPQAALAGGPAEGPAGVVPPPPRAAAEDLPTAVPVEETGSEGQVEPAPAPASGPAPGPVFVDGQEDRAKEAGQEAPAAAPARAPGVRVGVRLAGGVGFARLLPGPSGAASLAISARGRGWRAELGGLYLPPVAGGSAAIGGVFQAGAVELRGCPALTRGRIELPLCAGLQLGAMQGSGRGTGFESTRVARALWLAGTLGAALAWRPRERVGLWLQVDAVVVLIRPRFETAAGRVVHEASRFGGQALAGIELRVR